MADTTEQDPSIEEILASIRQIISDDDDDVEETSEEEVAAPEEPEPIEEEPEEDVFQLTEDMQEVEEEPEVQSIDFQPQEEEEEIEAIEEEEEAEIFTEPVAASTIDSFKKLSDKVALANYSDNVTLEEIVKDMLRPMLREWIDSNMPQIVEVLVEKELEKLARHAKDS